MVFTGQVPEQMESIRDNALEEVFVRVNPERCLVQKG
jgi:hypothetical protein